MNHVVYTSVIEVAGPDADSPLHRFSAQKVPKKIQAADERLGIEIKLEEIRRLPVFQFSAAGKKAAGAIPVRQSGEHMAVYRDILWTETVENDDEIDVAAFRGFSAAVTALQSGKTDSFAESPAKRIAEHPDI